MPKKSASLQAAQMEFFRNNNIQIPEKVKKSNKPVRKPSEFNVEGLGLNGVKDFGIYIENINKLPKLIDMDDNQVVSLILQGYDATLKHIIKPEIRFDAERIKNFLYVQSCHEGICFYSRKRLGVSICDSWWVKQYASGARVYWYDIPRNLWTAPELIKSISLRVERLTEILNSFQDEEKR